MFTAARSRERNSCYSPTRSREKNNPISSVAYILHTANGRIKLFKRRTQKLFVTSVLIFSALNYDPPSGNGSYDAGANTSYRQRREGQSLRPSLPCPTETDHNLSYFVRYRFESNISSESCFCMYFRTVSIHVIKST